MLGRLVIAPMSRETMATHEPGDIVLETLTSPDGAERVLIVRRVNRVYSYRMQFRTDPRYKGPGVHIWPDDYAEEPGWNPQAHIADYSTVLRPQNGRRWARLPGSLLSNLATEFLVR